MTWEYFTIFYTNSTYILKFNLLPSFTKRELTENILQIVYELKLISAKKISFFPTLFLPKHTSTSINFQTQVLFILLFLVLTLAAGEFCINC